MPNDYIYESILTRVSSDNCGHQQGRWLIELYIDNELYILNGRTLGDLTGKFTCHTPRGSGLVDYFLTISSLSSFV